MSRDHPVDVIIFDMGSTLIYFDGNLADVMKQARHQLAKSLVDGGMIPDAERFYNAFVAHSQNYYQKRDTTFIEYSVEYILRATLKDYNLVDPQPDILRRAINSMYRVIYQHWQVEPDTVETIAELKSQGYQIGLISNAGDEEEVQNLIDKAGLRPYLGMILISAVVGVRKPHPFIFQQALKFWRVKPSRAVMVGDLISADVLGAHQSGMAGIWITRRGQNPDNQIWLSKVKPDGIVKTLADIPGLLQEWNK